MKIFIEPNHQRILLEEGDKMVTSLSLPGDITTLEIGYIRDGVEHWDGPIQPVKPQVNLTFDYDLYTHPRAEHARRHPLDLYSIIETDLEPDEVIPSEEEENDETVARLSRVVQQKPSRLGLHQKKADGPKVWRVSGTGKYAWANNV